MGSLWSPRRRLAAVAGATFVACVAFVVGAIGAAPAPRALAGSSGEHDAMPPEATRERAPGTAVPLTVRRAPPPTTAPASTGATAPPVFVACPVVVTEVQWPSGWRVECEGRRPGLLGLTLPSGITYLYVRSGAVRSLQRAALHEAGHAWNLTRLGPAAIATWCGARGCDASRFFVGGEHRDGWSEPGGAEDWAAVWSACHGGEYHRSYLGLAAPDAALCALQNTLTAFPS